MFSISLSVPLSPPFNLSFLGLFKTLAIFALPRSLRSKAVSLAPRRKLRCRIWSHCPWFGSTRRRSPSPSWRPPSRYYRYRRTLLRESWAWRRFLRTPWLEFLNLVSRYGSMWFFWFFALLPFTLPFSPSVFLLRLLYPASVSCWVVSGGKQIRVGALINCYFCLVYVIDFICRFKFLFIVGFLIFRSY